MSQSIEVIVTPQGEIVIEAIGFKGGACEKATAAIEQALGATRAKRRKPEFLQQAAPITTQQSIGR